LAFGNYQQLLTSIQNYLGRPVDPTMPQGSSYDDFVLMFEADANTRLRTHFQETSGTITTVAGTPTYALPTDLIELREVAVISVDPVQVLQYVPPAKLDSVFGLDIGLDPDSEDLGQPEIYTLEATNIRFGPTPDQVYTIRLGYYQGINPPLAQGVNWLFQQYPNIYLIGSLIEAEIFFGATASDSRVMELMQRREGLYQQIMLADRKYRLGPAPLKMMPPIRFSSTWWHS